MTGQSSFFAPDGEAFVSTELTRGPWSAEHQHGGPPTALMVRAIEHGAGAGMQLVRVTVTFLRPVPIARLALTTDLERRGRNVEEWRAELAHDGTPVARARALLLRRQPLALPQLDVAPVPVALPADSAHFEFPFFLEPIGYHTGMEVRIARGTFGRGPVAAWMRMRHPLLPGEAPSPAVRTVIAADSGNGVSVVLDTARYTFINPDLTVYLHRAPEGEWVCLDARTLPEPSGLGLAVSDLYDERGPIGRGLQSLLVRDREH